MVAVPGDVAWKHEARIFRLAGQLPVEQYRGKIRIEWQLVVRVLGLYRSETTMHRSLVDLHTQVREIDFRPDEGENLLDAHPSAQSWARKLGLVENPAGEILQHPAAKSPSAAPTLEELVEQITPMNRYAEFQHEPDPDASDSDLDAERNRERESQKLAAWFLAPNGWIAKPGPDGLTPIAPIDALDRLEDVINALKKREETNLA